MHVRGATLQNLFITPTASLFRDTPHAENTPSSLLLPCVFHQTRLLLPPHLSGGSDYSVLKAR